MQALSEEAQGRYKEKRRPASPSSIFRKTSNPSCAAGPEGTAIIASHPGSDPQLSSRSLLDVDRRPSPSRTSFVCNSSGDSIASNTVLSDSDPRFDANSPDSELSSLDASTHTGRAIAQDEPLFEVRLGKLKNPATNSSEILKPSEQLIRPRPALSDSPILKGSLDFNELSGLHVVAIEGKENVVSRSGLPKHELKRLTLI